MTRARSGLLLALLVVAPAPWAQEADPSGGGAALSAGDRARLERGETVMRLDERPGLGVSEGLAFRVLARPLERVWVAVADLDHWHEWVPFLAVSERIPAAGPSPAWQLRFELPFPLRDRHYRVVAEVGGASEAGRAVSWRSLPASGNVAWARGAFTLEPRGPGRTLVTFRTATDTGDRTPRFLLDRTLRESLPWVLEGLAQQVNRCRYSVPRPDGCREAPPGSP